MMLDWIDEQEFESALQTLTQQLDDARMKADQRRVHNVVDPFWSLFVASTFDVGSSAELRSLQQFESAIRGMSNAVGRFHQTVLGSVKNWEDHDTGYDLICSDRKLIAEVKNKWNTLNAPSKKQAVNNLSTVIYNMRGPWTAYLVQIIPKTPVRYEKELDRNVIETDGASFYHLVTGHANAIHEIFDVLVLRLAPSNEISAYCQAILDQSLPPRT
ncbi:MAG: Eco47II family restriction endonuclease [Chloroflexota bacterium]|nr:Eco47II family restriction endonuclease [Chloroflexota bacterium]